MSSVYSGSRRDENNAWNPLKYKDEWHTNWQANRLTCMQTQNDKTGPWWQAKFGGPVTVSKVQILNRGDCCAHRL